VSEPEIDMFYADVAFLETDGTTATKVKAAVWAWDRLHTDDPMSLYDVRAFLVASGFQVVTRGDVPQ
jgi:hypothetical protein